MKKMFWTFIVVCGVLLRQISFSETTYEQVNVVLNDAGTPPFHMQPEVSGHEVTKGIVVDLLNAFQKAYPKYHIRIIGIPKIREQLALDDGTADMTYNSLLFAGERAKNFLWSEAFVKIQDCVVMLKKNRFPFEKPDDLFGKTVGKIRGFGYGEYDQYFQAGKIIGHDVKETLQLIKMLKDNRIDCFFGNTYITPYEIKLHQENVEEFYFSEKPLYEFELMFQINQQKTTLKEDLDTFIKYAKEHGVLQKIEEQYR